MSNINSSGGVFTGGWLGALFSIPLFAVNPALGAAAFYTSVTVSAVGGAGMFVNALLDRKGTKEDFMRAMGITAQILTIPGIINGVKELIEELEKQKKEEKKSAFDIIISYLEDNFNFFKYANSQRDKTLRDAKKIGTCSYNYFMSYYEMKKNGDEKSISNFKNAAEKLLSSSERKNFITKYSTIPKIN